MRLNALISASLAVALLSSGHMLLAGSPHKAHRASVRKASASSTARPVKKHTAKSSKKRAREDAVRVRSSSRRGKRRSAPMLQAASAHAEGATKRKATSDDFMKAAGAGGTTSRAGAQLAAARASDLAGADTNVDNASPTASTAGAARAPSLKPRLDTIEEEAATPVILPALYNKRGRLIVPPPLRGSHEILVRQNVVADRDGLDRIQDDNDLVRMRAARMLVSIPVSNALDVDDRLPANRRYTRPWTAQFLATLARAHYARFHTSLQVNSAVRTVEFQQKLQRTNGNAAPAEGETASPHLTGQAIDLAKHGLSMTEIAWLRGYLLPLSQQGRIDVEEEFQQACFHISVYKKYIPSTPKREIASTRHGGTTALAAAIN
jgi:hypothetical protein